MRSRILAIVLVALSGCASSEEAELDGPIGPATKIVTGKVVPTTLMATDGTICNVSALRFQNTSIGDVVFCEWRRRSHGPPRAGAPAAKI